MHRRRDALVIFCLAAHTAMALRPPAPLPAIGLGSAEGPAFEAMADAVAVAMRGGMTLVDCAQNYGSEKAVGEGLRRSGVARENAFVLCKVDLCSRAAEDPKARMRRQVARSLENLGCDYVDGVAFHWPLALDKPVGDDEARSLRVDAWRELEMMVEEGLVGCLGVSNFSPALLDELLEVATRKPVFNEVELSPACYQAELLAHCATRGVKVVAYSPLGGCWLAKYFGDFVPWAVGNCLADSTVCEVAREAGCSPAQTCVAWALAKGALPIPKSLRPERIEEFAACGDISLTEAQVSRLDALGDARRGVEASLEAHARIIGSPGYSWDPT
mmetsp:Transcript_4349/g.12784  ORF Transcript_4349/g.12784 Transcript_4349/m.12784 type:complete len:330 (-) Transcript_4349:35-1024(-)